jgi:hypothetical protein
MSQGAQNMKTEPDAVGTAKTIPGAQRMKTGPDGLGTAENESGQEK